MDSDIDDTFTIIMQYSGEQRNLVVTVKTAIVTPLRDQLKFFIRGTGGSYVKVRSPLAPLRLFVCSFADIDTL